ncbi:MAG: ribosome silencing factor [Candidatus Kapaibacteriota bacterium]
MNIIKELNDTQKLAVLCAQLADDKLGKNIVVLGLNKLEFSPADYFVVCSGESTSQVKAICELILANARDYRLVKPKVEGEDASEWIIIDFFDVVVHIMLDEVRNFYKIEKLWSDADFYTVDNDAYLVEAESKDYNWSNA